MKTTLIPVALLTAQLHFLAGASSPGTAPYIAHEWGTFTSVQGADGKLLEWNPLTTSKLPGFVYDRTRPGLDPRREYGAVKGALFARQRMETPVIYFYAEQEMAVDVTVGFPKGIITEWYPYASRVGPSWVKSKPALRPTDRLIEADFIGHDTNSVIRWSNVRVRPPGCGAAHSDLQLARDSSGSHYYAARETDANVIEVTEPNGRPSQDEKFLFYRGVGSFDTPLEITSRGPDAEHLTLSNSGRDALGCVIILKVDKGAAGWWKLDRLAGGERKVVEVDWNAHQGPLGAVVASVGAALREALEAQGLFAREASAMVETWRDSWLEEQGLRVLYLLPRHWTDEALPMTLAPRPQQLARVMVGRVEMITPRLEEQIRQQIVRFTEPDPKVNAQAVQAFQALRLGRFAEPALRRVSGELGEKHLQEAAWRLLQASQYGSGEKSVAGL